MSSRRLASLTSGVCLRCYPPGHVIVAHRTWYSGDYLSACISVLQYSRSFSLCLFIVASCRRSHRLIIFIFGSYLAVKLPSCVNAILRLYTASLQSYVSLTRQIYRQQWPIRSCVLGKSSRSHKTNRTCMRDMRFVQIRTLFDFLTCSLFQKRYRKHAFGMHFASYQSRSRTRLRGLVIYVG